MSHQRSSSSNMEDVKRTLEASLVRRCDSLNGGSLTRRNSPTRASEPTGLVKSCDSLAEMRVSDGNKAAYKAYWSVMSLGRKYNSSSREKKYGSFVSSKLRKFNSLLVKEEKMTSLLAAPADPAKRALEAQVEEQKQQLEEMEDELQLLEDSKMRLEVNLQAKVNQLERELANKDEGVEESRKGLLRQLRDLETELEEERRQKTAAVGAKKKIESEFADMEASVENAQKMKEDAQKQYRKMQTIVTQYTTEIEELRAGKEDALNTAKDADKKYKLLEAELAQLQEELAAAERGKRVAQNERDEANEELSTSNLSKNSLLDEKKRLEARVNALEDEMEEEASNSELAMEKARKLQAQVDQMQLDLGNEKALSNKAESARSHLEKQNKELKLRVAELEEISRKGNKTQVAALESKVSSLEDQLEVEQRERQQLSRNNRRQEKKLKELTMQMDEERRHADQYKEQLEKAQSAKKSVQRDLTEMEEEVSRLNAQRRRLQREFDEATEGLEAAQREISSLKSRLSSVLALVYWRTCGSVPANDNVAWCVVPVWPVVYLLAIVVELREPKYLTVLQLPPRRWTTNSNSCSPFITSMYTAVCSAHPTMLLSASSVTC
ncbi:hypothetical protein EB796_013726 [Bugula neritina]|uniref:Paramyosin n=1 Tax=Bugula neritina TaxID=10212 RepID=A0A7J7JPQ5_BUGNE|nr:hypothetical protein EB796_013726 [Bugula neritina]